MECLICRSPNNRNGDGIVCDQCGFVTLYVCVRERGEERGGDRGGPLQVKDGCSLNTVALNN